MAFEVNLQDINLRYGRNRLLEEYSFSTKKGELTVITGNSGAGKSTILEIVAGVIEPDSGTVSWNGIDVHRCGRVKRVELDKQSAVVFQDHALISYLPLFENIALPLRHHRRGTKEEIDRKVSALLERFGLTRSAGRLPEALSVGEKRLGSIARAMVVDPGLLCMDEPTEGLDEIQYNLFLEIFSEFHQSEDCTIVVTTNHKEFVDFTSDHVINLNS